MEKIIPKSIQQVDIKIKNRIKSFELLPYLNPINLELERKKFFKHRFEINPDFKYKKIQTNLKLLKRELFSIKTETIDDDKIRQLYDDTIQSYIDKIDMLSFLGSKKFLYNSLQYFGQPSTLDVKQAYFLLMCPDFTIDGEQESYTDEEAVVLFQKAIEDYDFQFTVELSTTIVSRVLVVSGKNKMLVKKGIFFTKIEILALVEHEIGIHILTTNNAREQPLRIFSLGMPNNTKTQEGLAVISEYMTNNLTMSRLRDFALRVMAVKSMIEGNDFKTTFKLLHETHKIPAEKAFYMNTRVYRGGGFTKDYLYLNGLRNILRKIKQEDNLVNLLTGKTSMEYLSTINKMVELNYVIPPKYISKSFDLNKQDLVQHPIFKYLLEGLVKF